MINLYAAILSALETALPGAELYAGVTYPPAGATPSTGQILACIWIRGGQGDEEDALLSPSVQFKVYGATATEAWSNYRAVEAALEGLAGPAVTWGYREAFPQLLQEIDSGWHFALLFYNLQIRNTGG